MYDIKLEEFICYEESDRVMKLPKQFMIDLNFDILLVLLPYKLLLETSSTNGHVT